MAEYEKLLINDSLSMSEAREIIFEKTSLRAIQGLGEPPAASARPGIYEIAPWGGKEAVCKSKNFM